MSVELPNIREFDDVDAAEVFSRVAGETRPAVFRGVAAHWPLVEHGRASPQAARAFLLSHWTAAPVTVFHGDPAGGGRLAYTDDLESLNFRQLRTGFDEFLATLERHEAEATPPTIYMGSTAISQVLPGLAAQNSLPPGDRQTSIRIWIGNRTTVAAHFDVMDNLACVCAGRRRFTLFPPDQVNNLYVGPLDFTPAGQAVSLVDPGAPDLDRYPRFAEALRHAQAAELGPGDAIFVPSMWWHHVRGLDAFNVLVNHWWRDVPSWAGPPGDALLHAILEIRDLPAAQREAWRQLFEHYVFEASDESVAHIPESRRGVLGRLDDDAARRLRTLLRNGLNR